MRVLNCFYMHFMHINASVRSVLLFNKKFSTYTEIKRRGRATKLTVCAFERKITNQTSLWNSTLSVLNPSKSHILENIAYVFA